MDYLEVEKLQAINNLNDVNDVNDANDVNDVNDVNDANVVNDVNDVNDANDAPNTIVLDILNTCGITCSDIKDLAGIIISRELLLNDSTYDKLKANIPKLKQILSSTSFTSVHKNADESQKWPLINLIRQLLRKYNYLLVPQRVCDGYTKAGKKKYKRLFEIKQYKSYK